MRPLLTASRYELAQRAYEGYWRATDGRSVITGYELPAWCDLSTRVQQAWVHAVGALGIQQLRAELSDLYAAQSDLAGDLASARAEVAALKRLLKKYCRCSLRHAAGDGCECCNPDLAIPSALGSGP